MVGIRKKLQRRARAKPFAERLQKLEVRKIITVLSGLPIVGGLFSFTSNNENRRDLIILVTPRILDDTADVPAE